jgi:hypothetical protein
MLTKCNPSQDPEGVEAPKGPIIGERLWHMGAKRGRDPLRFRQAAD